MILILCHAIIADLQLYPGIGSMGKSMEFMGRPWFPHASHASLAFPCYAKAWKSMGSMGILFRLHQQSMD